MHTHCFSDSFPLQIITWRWTWWVSSSLDRLNVVHLKQTGSRLKRSLFVVYVFLKVNAPGNNDLFLYKILSPEERSKGHTVAALLQLSASWCNTAGPLFVFARVSGPLTVLLPTLHSAFIPPIPVSAVNRDPGGAPLVCVRLVVSASKEVPDLWEGRPAWVTVHDLRSCTSSLLHLQQVSFSVLLKSSWIYPTVSGGTYWFLGTEPWREWLSFPPTVARGPQPQPFLREGCSRPLAHRVASGSQPSRVRFLQQ